jgi:hypothetical protein
MSPAFRAPPKLSVTAIHGGEGYTITPDLCGVNVDARTTPDFLVDEHPPVVGSRFVVERCPGDQARYATVLVAWRGGVERQGGGRPVATVWAGFGHRGEPGRARPL